MEVPFFKPKLEQHSIDEVVRVLESGWLTTGPKTHEFEKVFAEYVRVDHAVFLTSCTAALHLALAICDLKPGDEVITTPLTFAATAEVIEYFDAKPIFVDIREDTLNIDEAKVESAISERTKAILPVHYAGHPVEMTSLKHIANKHNLTLIEDAAHCLPSVYRETPVGSIGDMTCFSFYANKCLTTGEGGMLTTNNKAFAERARRLRLHGLSADAANRFTKKRGWAYDILERGYKYNPTDMTAAMGLGQIKRLDSDAQKRRALSETYLKSFESLNQVQCLKELPHCQSSWHLFPIRLQGYSSEQRDQIIDQLHEKNIGTSVHYIPLHMHSFYRERYGYQPEDFPKTLKAYEGLITLPLYPEMSFDQVDYVVEQLKLCL